MLKPWNSRNMCVTSFVGVAAGDIYTHACTYEHTHRGDEEAILCWHKASGIVNVLAFLCRWHKKAFKSDASLGKGMEFLPHTHTYNQF